MGRGIRDLLDLLVLLLLLASLVGVVGLDTQELPWNEQQYCHCNVLNVMQSLM